MIEVAEVTRRLLAGERVSLHGAHVVVCDAILERPRPIQQPVPLLVGGNGATVLRFAAQEADIVGFTGSGRTLEDGHRHQALWRRHEIEERVELARTAAEGAGRRPKFEALVQVLEVTDDAEAAAKRLAEQVPNLTVDDVFAAPYALIGTIPELVSQLRDQQRRLGFSRYVFRSAVRQAAARLLSAL